jgi:hypothetical protein
MRNDLRFGPDRRREESDRDERGQGVTTGRSPREWRSMRLGVREGLSRWTSDAAEREVAGAA